MKDNQFAPPNLEHVAIIAPARLDSVAVQVSTVKGTGGVHPVAVTGSFHVNVSSRDRHVIEKDICRTVSSYGGQISL